MFVQPVRVALLAGSLGTILTLLPGTGCSWRYHLFQAGIPGVGTRFVVSQVANRGGFLDALLHMERGKNELRIFAPAESSCQAVLQPQARVTWSPSGAVGTLAREGRTCHATGIGSLSAWRQRGPEPIVLGASPVPREHATYHVVYQDPDVIFLRGRFPLASLIGWSGLDDSIAVVPQETPCTAVAAEGVASMQYYPAGTPVLALASGAKLCPIDGLIQPPAG
jgi:hypothetical protein